MLLSLSCDICGSHVPSRESCSSDWVAFPDGVRLPAIPCWNIDGCEFCGVEFEKYHHSNCIDAECPRCFRKLTSCGCLNSENLFPRPKMSRAEIVNRINEIATEYLGEVTKLDQVIGDTADAVLWAKLAGFEELILRYRVGKLIVDKYPDVVVRKWRETGSVPAFYSNAESALRFARGLWFQHFWK